MDRLKSLAAFAGMVLAVVLVLKLLNWVPAAFSKEAVRGYRSIEDARAALKLRRIYLPSYFPQYLSWPPDEILGRGKPHTLVLMHFDNDERREIALAIRQADSRDKAPLKTRIEPVRVHSREDISIKGIPAVLLVAECPGKRACNSVSWQEEGYAFTVIAKDSVQEVVRIAESMVAHDQTAGR